jgi:two-component system cell cycle response regulator DivK
MESSVCESLKPVNQRPLILVVEDNEDNLLLLNSTLTLFGWEFISTTSGQRALALAKSHTPDLILLDVLLPDLNGLEVIAQLKQDYRTKAIPVIAVTALAKMEDRNRILSAGFQDYISKPYMLDHIEASIRHHLGYQVAF